MSLGIAIVKAVPEDAEAIMTLKRDAWISMYIDKNHDVTREELIQKFGDMPSAIKNWQSGIATETEDGPKCTFVARVDGKTVGYTSPETAEGQRRVGAMYVTPALHRHGIGRKLLQKAVEWHGRDQDIFLHVVSYNHRAIQFYENFGFEKTGIEFPEEYDEVQKLRYLPETEMVLRA